MQWGTTIGSCQMRPPLSAADCEALVFFHNDQPLHLSRCLASSSHGHSGQTKYNWAPSLSLHCLIAAPTLHYHHTHARTYTATPTITPSRHPSILSLLYGVNLAQWPGHPNAIPYLISSPFYRNATTLQWAGITNRDLLAPSDIIPVWL